MARKSGFRWNIIYDSLGSKILPFQLNMHKGLVNETSADYVAGGFQVLMSFYKDAPKLLDAFTNGKRIAHDKDLFEGTERMFKPGYMANLVSSWIPALDNGNVEQALKKGGLKVAYIGCGGYGASTIIMAKAYPN